jgi:hypothetical protein
MKKENLKLNEVITMFDDIIDEKNGMIKISGYEYYASDVFDLMDPEAYREEFLEYYDSIRDNFYCEELEK